MQAACAFSTIIVLLLWMCEFALPRFFPSYVYVYMCVLCCFALFVCLTLLASFFLPSHLSFKNMYNYTCTSTSIDT